MKIGIFGAGAIGGFLGFRLAQAGAAVTFLARGKTLEALRTNGLTLKSAGKSETIAVRATADAMEAGLQDYVIASVKAHALPAAAPQIAQMMGENGAVVTAINGIPYWYLHGLDAPVGVRTLESVDPGGAVSRALPPGRAIGCVVYPAAEVIAPGVIEHTYGDKLTLGEPDGSKSERVERLSKLMQQAGLKAPVRPRIRDEMWVKLWGNLAFNPLSALTGSTLDRLAGEPDLRAVARAMMIEAQALAEALGVKFAIDVEKRIDGAREVGAHKTSMLQDLERGRPMEIDALLGSAVELGDMLGHAMPMCRSILALVRERARRAGCYP
jgi:2-dehydropantoate 2-reductase